MAKNFIAENGSRLIKKFDKLSKPADLLAFRDLIISLTSDELVKWLRSNELNA